MWIITVYSKENDIKMFEFNTKKEASEAFKHIEEGYKILSEVIYLNEHSLTLVGV